MTLWMCASPSGLGWRPLLYAAGAAAATAGAVYLFICLFYRCRDRQQSTTVDAEVQTATEDPVQTTLDTFASVELSVLCAVYRDYMQDLDRSTPEASPVACLPAPPQAPPTPPHEAPLTPPPQTPPTPPPQRSPQASLPPSPQPFSPEDSPTPPLPPPPHTPLTPSPQPFSPKDPPAPPPHPSFYTPLTPSPQPSSPEDSPTPPLPPSPHTPLTPSPQPSSPEDPPSPPPHPTSHTPLPPSPQPFSPEDSPIPPLYLSPHTLLKPSPEPFSPEDPPAPPPHPSSYTPLTLSPQPSSPEDSPTPPLHPSPSPQVPLTAVPQLSPLVPPVPPPQPSLFQAPPTPPPQSFAPQAPPTPPPQPLPTPPLQARPAPPRPYSVPEPQPNPTPTGDSAPEAAEYTIPPEAWQVPALYNYCTIKRICSIPLKLNALRQAFAIILSDNQCCSYISEASRRILAELAHLNARDQTLFQQAYDPLLAFTQNPSLRGLISAELVQIGINYFNVIDVVFEVVVLGVLGGARPPIFPSPGGFLDHLMVMLFTFTPTSKFRNPRAEDCFFLLQTQALLLLEDLFAGEEDVYAAPESLAAAVWNCVDFHIRAALETFEAV